MMLPTITSYLASIGCAFPEIDLLQPADPFLDTTGEDLRRRIFMTQENSGKALCLRPEFTIPVCLNHLEKSDGPAQYAYGGKVFRQRADAPTEFTQAGFEDLGNADKPAADITCINTALGLLETANINKPNLIVGDQSIFVSLLDALEIPGAWRKKLLRAFGDTPRLLDQLQSIGNGTIVSSGLPEGLAKALGAGDENAVLDFVTEHMVANGLPLSGGRTPQAIVQRLIEQEELQRSALEKVQREALKAYLAIEVEMADAADAISGFEKEYGLNLNGAAARVENLASGISGGAASALFRASFGRRLDYYTGLVFEIYREGLDLPMIGGGRYDQLLTLLGAKEEVPAVGFAVWVDRLGGAS